MSDEEYMRHALGLARRGTGYTAPNPRVGCVIVKNGTVIGEGWHERYGEGHAELNAIRNAGASVEGATAYVTLEPCSHFGKTPPCANLLVDKKIARVVIGMLDPNPLVSGNGVEILQQAGIHVRSGVLEEDCAWVNRFFSKFITKKIPYVIGKSAQSLDGCIANHDGESKWITGLESRRRGHILRATVDAVLVGRATVEADDPELTVRLVKGRNPRRIILDTNLSLSPDRKIFSAAAQTFVICSREKEGSPEASELRSKGAIVLSCDSGADGFIDPGSLLAMLGEINISSLLIEGGAGVLSSFAEKGQLDELHIFTAPVLIGGGRKNFSGMTIASLNEAPGFSLKTIAASGADQHAIYIKRPAKA